MLISLSVLAQNHKVEVIKKQLKAASHDSIRCRLLNELSEIAPEGEWEKYNDQLYQLSSKNIRQYAAIGPMRLIFLRHLSTALNNKAVAAQLACNDQAAINYLKRCIEIQKKIDDKSGLSISLNNLGILYNSQGNTRKATESFFSSLQLAEGEGDLPGIATAYINLSVQYSKENNFEKQIEFLQKALKASEKTNDTNSIVNIHHFIGEYYHKKGDLENAFKNYQICFNFLKNKGSNMELVNILHSMGEYYSDVGNLTAAEEFYSQSLKVSEEINDNRGYITALYDFANLYELQRNYQKASSFGKKGLDLSRKLGYPVFIAEGAKKLKSIYQKQEKYQLALTMHELYIAMRDSISNEQTRKATLQSQLQFEFDKKEATSKLQLELFKERTEAKNKNQMLLVSLSFGLTIISLLIMFFTMRYRKLRSERKSLHFEQKLLRSQMNPHFLFNSLNSIQRMFVEGNIKTANDVMSDFSNLLRRILNNSEKERISLKEELDTLKLYLDLEKIRCNHAFSYEFEVGDNINQLFVSVPPLIFQPFAENAIWHGILPSKRKGQITIRIFRLPTKNSLYCEVIDNGIGFMTSAFKQHESKGIQITEKRLATKVSITSVLNQGTTISFNLKLKND